MAPHRRGRSTGTTEATRTTAPMMGNVTNNQR